MDTVFLVEHLREDPDGYDDIKTIGIYSSMERARNVVETHRKLSGFVDNPDGFSISECKIDRDNWNEGFVDMSGDS